MVARAGLEAWFTVWADRVATRTSPAPPLSQEEVAERMQRAVALAPKYRIEIL
jgi:hypothetical protein